MIGTKIFRASWSWTLVLVLGALACNFNRPATNTPAGPTGVPGALATAAAATVSAELTRVGALASTAPASPVSSPAGTATQGAISPAATASPTALGTAAVCGSALPSRLTLDEPAQVIVFQVNLRSVPGLAGSPITQLARDRIVQVVDGPSCTDDLWWWEVFSEELGVKGWVAEADEEDYFLAP